MSSITNLYFMVNLFIVDEHKQEKEFGLVTIEPPLESCFTSGKIDKIVIFGYSKEEKILSGKFIKHTFHISSLNKIVENKIMDFGEYLNNRKKAAVIKLEFGNIYILPMSNLSEGRFLTCVSLHEAEASTEMKVVNSFPKKATGEDFTVVTKSSDSDNKSFLSSLLNKMESTNKIRTTPLISGSTNLLNRLNVVDRFKALEERLRQQLYLFDTDSTFNLLRLEPMDKDERYVVHDVVSEYTHLVSTAIGDHEARHVIVYRVGYQPDDLELSYNKDSSNRNANNLKKTQKATQYGKPIAPTLTQQLVQVNTVKRDRRTTEEIQEEIKKRKTVSF